jgi:hypothetical protein
MRRPLLLLALASLVVTACPAPPPTTTECTDDGDCDTAAGEVCVFLEDEDDGVGNCEIREEPPDDAGVGVADGGGNPLGDGGPPADGGDPPVDAGGPPADAGQPGDDAGPPPPPYDAGPLDPPVRTGFWSFGANDTDGFTTDSIDPENGELLVAYVVTPPWAPLVNVTGVSGFASQWSRRAQQCSARQQTGVEVWTTQNPNGASGINVDPSYVVTNAAVVIVRYENTNGATPVGVTSWSGNTGGPSAGCNYANSTMDATSWSLATTATPGSVVVGAAATRAATHNPTVGIDEFVARFEGAGDDVAGISAFQLGVTAPSPQLGGTFGSATDYAVIAIELREP